MWGLKSRSYKFPSDRAVWPLALLSLWLFGFAAHLPGTRSNVCNASIIFITSWGYFLRVSSVIHYHVVCSVYCRTKRSMPGSIRKQLKNNWNELWSLLDSLRFLFPLPHIGEIQIWTSYLSGLLLVQEIPWQGQKKDQQFLCRECSPNDQAGKSLDDCQEVSVGGDISLCAAFEQLLYELINITVDMHTSLLRICKHINQATHMQLRKLKLVFLLHFSERKSEAEKEEKNRLTERTEKKQEAFNTFFCRRGDNRQFGNTPGKTYFKSVQCLY